MPLSLVPSAAARARAGGYGVAILSRVPKRTPSSRLFVAPASSARSLKSRAHAQEARVSVEPLESRSDSVLVRIKGGPRGPRRGWERVRELAGEHTPVHPVLTDEDGNELYPTGIVQVRFHQPPADEELERFARTNGLRVVERNRYQRSQVKLEPLSAAAYLPDVVAELECADDVRTAWQEVLTRYHRE
jgi:hypothetical protein